MNSVPRQRNITASPRDTEKRERENVVKHAALKMDFEGKGLTVDSECCPWTGGVIHLEDKRETSVRVNIDFD